MVNISRDDGPSYPDLLQSGAAPYGLNKAMRSDRKWFARNPSRLYRARPFVAGELPEGMAKPVNAAHTCWTLIRRMGPGFRGRVFIYLPDSASPLDSEEAIGGLFDGCLKGGGFMWAPLKYLRHTADADFRSFDALTQWDHTLAGGIQ